jgi:hypothetical protein
MALVKYNNNSISAVTSAASIPSGAMTLIKTLTASSSATLSFVNGSDGVVLDSTYPIYQFEFINIHPATDNVSFQFQTSIDNGSNYNVVTTNTLFDAYHNESDTVTNLLYQSAQDSAQSTGLLNISIQIGNDNDQSLSGTFNLFNPSSTTYVKNYIANTHRYDASDYAINVFTAGYANTTSAVNAIKFQMSSGNIDSGTIKLYGIKDS